MQTRAQAEDVLFGDEVFGNDTLPADQSDAIGDQRSGDRAQRDPNDPPNVVVSGWQVYDNKGLVVEKYEPFFDAGWDYLSLAELNASVTKDSGNLFGQRVMQFYDPRGQVIRTVNPDGRSNVLSTVCPGPCRSEYVHTDAVGSLHLRRERSGAAE